MHRVVLSFLIFFIAATAFAANVRHLSEMPSVDRVMREITSANPMETAARRMGAFEHGDRERSFGSMTIQPITPLRQRMIEDMTIGA